PALRLPRSGRVARRGTTRAGPEITSRRAVGVSDADRKQGDRPGEHEGRCGDPHPGGTHSVRMSPYALTLSSDLSVSITTDAKNRTATCPPQASTLTCASWTTISPVRPLSAFLPNPRFVMVPGSRLIEASPSISAYGPMTLSRFPPLPKPGLMPASAPTSRLPPSLRSTWQPSCRPITKVPESTGTAPLPSMV